MLVDNSEQLTCPRCGSTEFDELDSGPDTYEDDITYTSYRCRRCDLFYDEWIDKWCVDCDNWADAADAEAYDPSNPEHRQQA